MFTVSTLRGGFKGGPTRKMLLNYTMVISLMFFDTSFLKWKTAENEKWQDKPEHRPLTRCKSFLISKMQTAFSASGAGWLASDFAQAISKPSPEETASRNALHVLPMKIFLAIFFSAAVTDMTLLDTDKSDDQIVVLNRQETLTLTKLLN